ncbi:MAG: RluA family pseudouridine synthase, partial [Rhodospirillales bacterium]
LIAHCGDTLAGVGGVKRPGIVHRLDKDTSGLMVAAKTDRAHAALSAAFKDRTIVRRYLALVWGAPSPPAGAIEGNIGRDPRDRKRMAVVGGERGKIALTHYRILRRLGAASLVECRLATGRTHQIRVHLAARGHPVVGDPVYGGGLTPARRKAAGPAAEAVLRGFRRQALHANVIGFNHPVTGRPLEFTTPPPDDMKRLIDALAANPHPFEV